MKRSTYSVHLAAIVAVLAICWALPAQAQTTSPNIDPVEKWAWGTNVGWLNLMPADGGVAVYRDHLEGWAWGENIGWVRLGTAANGLPHTYANDSADDYGVNHDGSGNLSGYAWGTNIGWIDFSPSSGGVTIDLTTGRFDGYAWAENVGWISFQGTGDVAYNVKVGTRGIQQWPVPALGFLGVLLLSVLVVGFGVAILRRTVA